MSVLNTPVYKAEGTNVRVNRKELLGVRGLEDLGGASQDEIETSSLRSRAKEYTTGLPDYGSIPITGFSSPQSSATADLRAAEESGNQETVSVEVVIGGRPANVAASDGSGILVADNLNLVVSGTAPTITFKATAADGINGVSDGDLIGYQIASDTSDRYAEITAVSEPAGVPTFIMGKLTGTAPSFKASTTQSIIRPAVKYTFVAFVANYKQSINTNGIVEFRCDLRITGSITTEVGDPTVTLAA